jgi:hypothetical protein
MAGRPMTSAIVRAGCVAALVLIRLDRRGRPRAILDPGSGGSGCEAPSGPVAGSRRLASRDA